MKIIGVHIKKGGELFLKQKRAFTLAEILIVLGIIGILALVGLNIYNRTYLNSQIDTCESELRDFSTGFQGYMTDYGEISISPANSTYQNAVQGIVDKLNSKYLNYQITVTGYSDDCTWFTCTSGSKNDPWNNPYTLSIYTNDGTTGIDKGDNITGMIVVSSNGPDGTSNIKNYKDSYGDDIIAVIKPEIE